jgi:glycerophosphoryl diester phosphodiesterase
VRTEIIAHRGYSARAPENTLAAIEAALRAGADAVEWDVHVAACGTPVLIHDATLGRTTNGVGPVRRRTLAQLQALDAGSWFGPDFAGERVPSLAQALDRVKGRVGRIYTEVKGYRELEDLDRMVRVTRDADLLYDTVFISIDWGIVERIAGQDDTVGIGYIVDKRERFDEALERASASARAVLDLDHRLVLDEPALVEGARARGVEVAVWTVDDPAEADRLVRAGVTRLTTNEVERMLRWRAM